MTAQATRRFASHVTWTKTEVRGCDEHLAAVGKIKLRVYPVWPRGTFVAKVSQRGVEWQTFAKGLVRTKRAAVALGRAIARTRSA